MRKCHLRLLSQFGDITAKKDMPKDAKAHWDETGNFDKYFSPKPGAAD